MTVATGTAELQPVAPGNDLAGLVTARAAERLVAAGIELGHVVAVGTPPAGLDVEQVEGWPVRFEGSNGRVEAVVVRDEQGNESSYACDTVVLGLGVQPPQASWGSMLSAARDSLFFAPWASIFPGLAIFVCVLGLNLLGDGLRDRLDPRSVTRL